MEQDDRKLFVLDTNVLLHEPLAIYSFQEHDVVIPMTVLEELDQIKDRKSDVSRDARVAIRALEDTLGGNTTPEQIIHGVPLPSREGHSDATGSLAIFPDHLIEFTLGALP
ncbi:MAG: PIN domain-containing protein, partial [Shewanella sp.]